MLRLDVGTLAFTSAMLAAAAALTIALIGHRRSDVLPWPWFAASGVCYSLGVLAVIFPVPPYGGAFLAGGNGLVIVSIFTAHAGVCVLLGRRPPWWIYAVFLVVLVGGYVLAYTTDLSINHRIAFISVMRLPFAIHGAFLLAGFWWQTHQRSAAVLGGMFLAWVFLLTFRALAVLMVETQIDEFVSLVGGQAFYFACVGLLQVTLALAVLLMIFERDEAYLNDRIALQTRALARAKDVAESALAAKSRFLAATSHDLRQAVHALRLLLTAVVHEVSGRDEEEGEVGELVASMEHVVFNITEQLNALLDMSRLDARVVVPDIADVRLGELFLKLESQFRLTAMENDVDLRFIRTSAVVRSDPALLMRILGNLTSNAIKFARSRRVVIGCRRHGSDVLIQVWDDGIGIEPAHIERIFEEYQQLGNDHRDKAKGLGLGLSIARRMADLLGHRMDVRSTPGRGSIFQVAVPATGP